MAKNEEVEIEPDGKTLFEHLGFKSKDTQKNLKRAKKVGYTLLISILLGVLIDTFLETDKFVIAVPIIFLIVLIFKLIPKNG
jgi:F0F1-type ATP synthase assembly protein I